jgi:hypothetical protein
MWQATPSTLGSSKPSTTILLSGPNNRNFVLTEPVVPRSGRLSIHTPDSTTISNTALPRISRNRLKMASRVPHEQHNANTSASQSRNIGGVRSSLPAASRRSSNGQPTTILLALRRSNRPEHSFPGKARSFLPAIAPADGHCTGGAISFNACLLATYGSLDDTSVVAAGSAAASTAGGFQSEAVSATFTISSASLMMASR